MIIKNVLITFAILFLFTQQSVSQENNSICKTVNSINVSIDGREELISIVQYLGGYFRLNNFELEYKLSVDNYFGKYKEHEAVEFVKLMTKRGFTYDAPVTAMLYFSNDFELDKEFPEYLIRRIGGDDNAKEFARLMKQFAKDTKFQKFFQSQNEFYKQTVNDFTMGLSDFHEIETIEDFFGEKKNSYNIILSVLNSGNYGPSITDNGKTDIYSIVSAKGAKDGKPFFGKIDDILYIVWHEFGHSFVNKLTDKNYGIVKKYIDLQEPIKEQMKNQAYRNWATIVNEHVIRAVTVKLAEAKYGAEIAENIKQKEIGRSFYYITPICNQLDLYVQSRNKYKSFEDFYPILIESAFKEAQEANYSDMYLKNLNNTYKDIDYIVVSENEGDAVIQKEIYKYVEGVKNKFFAHTQIITDKEALTKDISAYSFLIYGTMKNNLLIKKFKGEMPIIVSDKCINADKPYYISDGKAIFNMYNPLNSNEYLIIYTAQKPKGIIGINNVRHGGTNFIIFENRNNIYKAGFILKDNNEWICK